MKIIYKWLVPGFLRKWDGYLLESYPVLWLTGAHFVVLYALVGAAVLFGAGFSYPVHKNGSKWVVDPIKPIEFGYDAIYIYTLALVLICAVIWAYKQFQARFPFYQLKDTLLTLLIYVGCFWLLIGVTASAYRMGTIVHTAWFWMDEDHIETFQKSGIYPYGMMLLPQDTSFNIPQDTLQFFKIREKALKKEWINEEGILRHRYTLDTGYWVKLLGLVHRSELSDLSDLSYRSYLLSLSDWSSLSDRSSLSSLSYLSYRSYRSDRSSLSYRTYQSYRSYQTYLSDLWYQWDLSDPLVYSAFSSKEKFKKIDALALHYDITNKQDTINKDPLIIIPSLPYQIEDAITSVKHARQFLHEGIFWRYFFRVGNYLLFLVPALFLISFLSLRHLLQVGIFALLAWFAWSFFGIKDADIIKKYWRMFNTGAYLLMPIAGFIGLVWMQFNKKQYPYFKICINMVFLGIALTLLGALNYGDGVTLSLFGYPIDAAFYGVQLIGLLVACLIPYVQALPKKQ